MAETMTELDDMIAGAKMWPADKHPITGESFIHCEAFDRRTEMQRITYNRRGPPDREVYRYDDDGPVWVRTLTDQEFMEAMDKWKRNDERWLATNGVFLSRGQTTTEGTFRTASGATTRGYMGGNGTWVWVEAQAK